MIQYPYRTYQAIGSAGNRTDVIYRPVAEIRVIGPAGGRELTALVDTGADLTLLPWDLADLLGVRLGDAESEPIIGIAGNALAIWHAVITIELITPGGGPRWAALVGFYAGSKPILGHAGFLDHFTAKFNGRAKQLTLTPNGTAPAAQA